MTVFLCCLWSVGKRKSVMQIYSEIYDSGLLNELKKKTITTVKQMYSNSLQSQSIQTPKSAVTNTSLLFTNASCFRSTKKSGAWVFFVVFCCFFPDESTQVCEDDERDVEWGSFSKAGLSPRLKNSQLWFLSGRRIATFLGFARTFSEKHNNGSTRHLYTTMETKHTLSPQTPKHAYKRITATLRDYKNCKQATKWEIMSAMLCKLWTVVALFLSLHPVKVNVSTKQLPDPKLCQK